MAAAVAEEEVARAAEAVELEAAVAAKVLMTFTCTKTAVLIDRVILKDHAGYVLSSHCCCVLPVAIAGSSSGGGARASNSGGRTRPGAGAGLGPGNAGGWPSTTGNPSGGGRSNNPPRSAQVY
jgi:hypothetical protein